MLPALVCGLQDLSLLWRFRSHIVAEGNVVATFGPFDVLLRQHCAFTATSQLRQSREIAALPDLGDVQVYGASPGVPAADAQPLR